MALIAAQLVACLLLLAAGLLHGVRASRLRVVERQRRVIMTCEADEAVRAPYQSSLSS
jgi:hypothetical protein